GRRPGRRWDASSTGTSVTWCSRPAGSMRPFASTISLDEARRRLEAAVGRSERTERVPLEAAAGRVASFDVVSPIDVPPFSRSAMDGYAVIAADTAGASATAPVRLRLIDRIFTGRHSDATLVAGTCA